MDASEDSSSVWVDSQSPKRFKTGWRRVWAAVLDSIVLWPLNWIEWGLIEVGADGDGEIPGWKRASLRDLVMLLLLPYFIVSSLPGAWEGLENVARREPLRGVDLALGVALQLWFLLEILTMLFNRRRRALHDFLAGTVVVRTEDDNDSV